MVFRSKNNRPQFSTVHLGGDDDASYGSGTEASIPPPPPPTEKAKNSIFRPRDAGEDLPRQAYMIEECDSIEAVDASFWPSYWNNWFMPTRAGGNYNRRRRVCVGFACLLVVCMILGLAIGVSSNDNDSERSSSFAAANGSSSSGSSGATIVLTSAPTSAPQPATCSDSIATDKACYNTAEAVLVAFNNCEAVSDDWIGIYETANAADPSELGDGHSMWLWTCNSQALADCNATSTGEIPFGGGLAAGAYKAFLVRRNKGGPYESYAYSDEFIVSDSC